MSESFDAVSLLPEYGFERAGEGQLHQWTYERSPISLSVIVAPNRFFQNSLNFAGHYNDGRTMKWLEFSIGEQTASREEAMALIAYYFRGLPRERVPSWIIGGWALEGHLPWRHKKQ